MEMNLSHIEEKITNVSKLIDNIISEIERCTQYKSRLNELSQEAKAQADELASKFRNCYAQAQTAYSSKDGATAKSLSAQGKALEAECRALNKKSLGMNNNAKDYLIKVKENKQILSGYKKEINTLNTLRKKLLSRQNYLYSHINQFSTNRPTFELTTESVTLGIYYLYIETLGSPIPTVKPTKIIIPNKQYDTLTEAEIQSLLYIVGFAEMSAQFEDFVTSSNLTLRTLCSQMFREMEKLEAKDSRLNNMFEPIWEKIAWLQEKVDSGHSLHRHGPELTNNEIDSRLKEAITPMSGEIKDAPPASTKFISYKYWVLTREKAFDEIENINGIDLSQPPPNSDTEYTIVLEYIRPIDEGFIGVGNKTFLFNSAGSPILKLNGNKVKGYTTTRQISGVTRTFTRIIWNFSERRWQSTQHFPIGKDWNDLAKSYSNSATLDKDNVLI